MPAKRNLRLNWPTMALFLLAASAVGCEGVESTSDDAGPGGGAGGTADAAVPGGSDGEGGQSAGGTGGDTAGGGTSGGSTGGGAGGGEPPACAGLADAAACSAAGCYWWTADGLCREAAPVNPCDQPDPATCQAAGCEWTDAGCASPAPGGCDGLREVACSARPECHWVVDRCELDPADLPCERLNLDQCAVRPECAWNVDAAACGARPEGLCAALDQVGCALRPDCQAELAPAPDCACPPCAADDPACDAANPPACECPAVFLRCGQARADCAQTPVEACEQTPGCHVGAESAGPCLCDCLAEDPNCDCVCPEVPACVSDSPADPCTGLDPMTCALDARCRLEDFEVCDGGPAPDPGMGAPAPEACVLHQRCVRVPDPCADMALDACRDSVVCHVEIGQICECDGGGANGGGEAPGGGGANGGGEAPGGVPADGGEMPPPAAEPVDPADRVAPPPPAPEGCVCNQIELCLGNAAPPPACEALANPADCAAAGCLSDIRWGDPVCAACAGAGARPACDPADPDCAAFAPICPDECYVCFAPAPVDFPCEALDPMACAARMDCQWAVPAVPCDCRPGDPACVCPDPGPGLCMPGAPPPPDGCFAFGPDTCEANGCALFASPVECPPCDPESGMCFPCDPLPPACVDLGTFCGVRPPDTCADDARCAVTQAEICESEPCMPGQACPEPVCFLADACVPAGGAPMPAEPVPAGP